jgi:predicted ribosomally synthesized peptide with nif11-like leader
MSQAIATQFIQKVNQNEGLRAEIISAGQDMKAIVAIAKREGFSLSESDLQAGGAYNTGNKNWTGCGSGQEGYIAFTFVVAC